VFISGGSSWAGDLDREVGIYRDAEGGLCEA